MIKKYDFSGVRALVIGDVMLDQYWRGEARRISPEAPVPVVRLQETDYRLGGAANVALNMASLGCQVSLFGVTGADEAAETLKSLLTQRKIASFLKTLPNYPTITKLRVLSQNQQLIRLDKETPYELTTNWAEESAITRAMQACDVLVLSDYAKGTLSQAGDLIALANAAKIPVVVDPKRALSNYTGATVITPNLREFREWVAPCEGQAALEAAARKALEDYQLQAMVITQGSAGMTVVKRDEPAVHLGAKGGEVFDVTGAGDTVVGVLAAALALGKPLTTAAKLATVAAGIVVGKVGTSSVTATELTQSIRADTGAISSGVITEDALRPIIRSYQLQGEKVVFTNGCYDVLHYGHLRYLSRARALGDRLVVGVNSDESIRQLKGPGRPLNNLADRMEMLAGLKVVDWVVPFEETTPGRLVSALNPDILAKSSERFNSVADIPATEGTEHVLARGGEVHLLAPTPNYSSTDLIAAMDEEVNA